MKTGLKVALGASAVLLIAIGGELLYLHNRNVEDAKPAATTSDFKMDQDDMTTYTLKHEHPMSLKDEKDLKGRNLWMSAAGQMNYFPYKGRVDYAHSRGVLLGAEKITVQDAVEQVAPKSAVATFRVPGGDKQVLLVFTRPDDKANPTKEYAVPVGFKQAGDYTFFTDDIFFYDNPHQVFSNWSPEIWKAVDEHRAILGMKENQVQMALGQVSVPHGEKAGDRTVDFDDQGHPKTVTFENGKATKIVDSK